MPDIFRRTNKKREKEAGLDGPSTQGESQPINQHKRSMTQYEFGNADKEDPRKKTVKGQKPIVRK